MEKFLVKKFPVNSEDISEVTFDKAAYEEENKCLLTSVHVCYDQNSVVTIYEVKKTELGRTAT